MLDDTEWGGADDDRPTWDDLEKEIQRLIKKQLEGFAGAVTHNGEVFISTPVDFLGNKTCAANQSMMWEIRYLIVGLCSDYELDDILIEPLIRRLELHLQRYKARAS